LNSNATADQFLRGRVALVTGSAHRTGAAIVRALADSGASVVINAKTSVAQAEALAREINERHGDGRAMVCMADITDEHAVATMVLDIVKRMGGIDILVNNAVVRKHGPLKTFPMADWRAVMASTLDGAFLCAKHATPHLSRSKAGRIINLSGVASHVPATGGAAVAAAKAGLEGLTRALAHELGPQGITVNCICPGVMLAESDPPQRAIDLRAYCEPEKLPIARYGRIDETVGTVLALCSAPFAYMTGQVIHVNGGLHYGS
jgi:3-oxoacyl-[acyl-carrier protein] reductase